MSKKESTSSTNSLQYNPASLGLYDKLTKSGGDVLTNYMQNPFNNGFFNTGQGIGMAAAQKQGGTNMNALLQNMRTSGIGGNAGNAFQLAQMGKIGRGTAAMGAQSTMANVQNALQRQFGAAQLGMSYNPLLTGQSGKSTQVTSGTGSWLPQLAGAAIGMGMGAMTGGASTLAGMAAKTATSAGTGSGPFGGSGNGGGGGLGSGFMPGSFAPAGFGNNMINPLALGGGI